MDNKLSELSKPFNFDDFMYGVRRGGVFNGETLADNLPDAAVSLFEAAFASLQAELEAKDKHIADIEHVVAAAKCDDELWDAMAHRLKTLEAKLATPVRLPEKYNMKMAGDKSTKSMFYGHNSAINDSAKAVRAAGFTVEGDE